ncbi:MAG TPA: ABC transporter substrate-binding protein [Arenicellales bacterium]|nr:ABC transporter substrate-binding protein [Arenicellales bacterium]
MRFLAGILLCLVAGAAAAADSLTILTWGGAYERSQRKAYFEPFTERTGIEIRTEQYNGGIEALREKVQSGNLPWDLIDVVKSDSIEACERGLLEPIDHDALPPAPDGTPAVEDFYPGALTRCAVAEVIYSTVLAFDVRAFPGVKPRTVSALFDLERFPGKRSLQRRPIAVLEWALRSYGVPRQEIYNLLSTERGLDLAFARLDRIKDQVIWWEDGAVPARLLAEGKVVMASGYNGRFFEAAVNDGQPIQTLWDAQLYDYSLLAIPAGAPNADGARRFLRFATASERLAAQARYISYGPARRSAMNQVWKHAATGIDVRPHLPTYPPNFARAIRKDHEWYARMGDRLRERFAAWLNE